MARGKQNRSKRIAAASVTLSTQEFRRTVQTGPNINILVTEENRRLSVTAIVPNPPTYTINVSPEELAMRHRRLAEQAAIVLASGSLGGLETLAHLGHEFFQELIVPERVQRAIAAVHADPYDEDAAPPLRVELTSSEFYLPWGLLYLDDPDLGVRPERFLGMAHVIARVPHEKDKEHFNLRYPTALSGQPPRLNYASHRSLHHACKYELPRLESLANGPAWARRADVTPLKKVDGTQPGAAARELRGLIKQQRPHIIHLACHGQAGESRYPGMLCIDDDFVLESDVFKKKTYSMPGAPVIFLNACEMAMTSREAFHSFVGALFDSGARAVLAPECAVADDKATYFAHAFYKHFVRREHGLAEAVWLAKRERLRRGDITGLVYSLFGQPEAVIETRQVA